MQQWPRIYLNLPQTSSVPKERGRVRSVPSPFFGMEKYGMHVAVETAPTLLHLTVFLFSLASWYFRDGGRRYFNYCRVSWIGVLRLDRFSLPRTQLPVSHPNVKRVVVPATPHLLCRGVTP